MTSLKNEKDYIENGDENRNRVCAERMERPRGNRYLFS